MLKEWLGKADRWVFQERHRAMAHAARAKLHVAFTAHPQEAGETYLEHLWFTLRMSVRLLLATLVLAIHGLLPFLLTRGAGNQVEAIYRIMRTRIPKDRREQIDIDYSV